MKYRKLIELYKKNQLNEIQKKQVEADIEKHEAISEYLFDQEDNIEGKEQTGAGISWVNEEKENEFTHMINRKIKYTFIKMGACVSMFTLAAVLFVIFLLPKVVDCFYYDPGEFKERRGNQISLDYCVYTELCLPGYNRDYVSVQRRGYGVYDIMILQNVSYNKSITNLSGRIERGKLTLYDPNVLQRPSINVFAWCQMEGDDTDSLTNLIDKEGKVNYCSAGSARSATKALEELDEQEAYVAYVSLDRMMPYEEFIKFLNGLDDGQQIGCVWCAVCTNEQSGNQFINIDNLGFQCEFSSSHALDWNREKYPHLVLWNDDSQNDEFDNFLDEETQSEEFMKTHFTSMLRYMADREEFLKLQQPWGDAQDYRNAADYVEENGLMIYGFAGIGYKKALLELNQEKEVYEICTQRLR